MFAKDILFLITHAEKRFAKIETLLFEQKVGYRIAHLHHNLFGEDTCNRFHQHLFDTNRLYLMPSNTKSDEEQLKIYNYRKIRKEKKEPRKFKNNDEKYYIAASNKNTFISNRYIYTLTPILIMAWLNYTVIIVQTDLLFLYIHFLLLVTDALSLLYSRLTNDAAIDILYVFCLYLLQSYKNN